MQDDLYYDHGEFLDAAASPEYQTSARYRDDVAAKLQRSIGAGNITPMGEEIRHDQRLKESEPYTDEEGHYGGTVQIAGALPEWAEAAKVSIGTFGSLEEVALAMAAPVCEIDPTYRRALREKIDRSVREGTLPSDVFKLAPR